MSRNESYDIERPQALGYTRTNGFHPPSANPLGGYGISERHTPGTVVYPSYVPPSSTTIPRSVRIPEHEYGFGAGESWSATNRHTSGLSQPVHLLHSNHIHAALPSLPAASNGHSPANHYHSSSFGERDSYFFRPQFQPTSHQLATPPVQLTSNPNTQPPRTTLLWSDLEPWMDEEYAKQVCGLMGWDPVNVKVPHPPPDPMTGQQANNPGYCFLTFPSAAHAASVLGQLNANGNGTVTMPNSNKPMVMSWAPSVPMAPPQATPALPLPVTPPAAQQQYPKEYSIFVGDLAPETSNSDLVAVFRNPVLGLRNDREPKFIRPFMSCKSAKIMLDPVTGVSRGYGFVRFTDEADQQRALIEMHGLYCLSRPMRISPATAKFKPHGSVPSSDVPQLAFPPGTEMGASQSVTVALPLPSSNQTKSVSGPLAAGAPNSASSPSTSTAVSSSGSAYSVNGSTSTPSLSSGGSTNTIASISSEDLLTLPQSVLAQIAQQYANSNNNTKTGNNVSSSVTGTKPDVASDNSQSRFLLTEESWKHHAQARAILGNLIGPNGEQLTSTDPYNTTVFVGGLSHLITEETLRTFFAPFGDIHYVKVPVGKHCGFVQFVRKADAERAIEKMQGFPVGGSRIRLSWGRSQYKAAQAAAQAAQTAALQAHYQSQTPAQHTPGALTPEQALQILQKIGYQVVPNAPNDSSATLTTSDSTESRSHDAQSNGFSSDVNSLISKDINVSNGTSFENGSATSYGGRPSSSGSSLDARQNQQPVTNFSPFSPDPNLYHPDTRKREALPFREDLLPHPSRSYAPGFGPPPLQMQDLNATSNAPSSKKVSPTSTRPPSLSRYTSFFDNAAPSFQRNSSGQEGVISRPSSGNASHDRGDSLQRAEHDLLQDLNGTLASLNLDQNGTWKSPTLASEDNAFNRNITFQRGTVSP